MGNNLSGVDCDLGNNAGGMLYAELMTQITSSGGVEWLSDEGEIRDVYRE